MPDLRVRDRDAALARPHAEGADADEGTPGAEGVGRFGRVTGSEGDRVGPRRPA
ncbi:hypothetical protein ACF09K_16350 [Streptomyces sp. NPDC014882]|uniref:hypothetical protein n=1 Tax=Streptomyces sp. NPDC014882 TaxID=3364927 RepID=UPI0036FA53B5